jgi:hypothetical protein
VTLAEARFRDFTPYTGTYTPPTGCGDRWSKVVLRLEGKVEGRQFDRLGYLHVGGVEILRTSTPEPSPDGIAWSVEKDVTRYSDTFRRSRDVEMLIGNVVDDTYTGVLDVKATLTFYAGRPAATPDRVLALQDGTLTTPRNSERVIAEVYATGSGGGCEEFWYLTVPDAAPYSCKAGNGPYRAFDVRPVEYDLTPFAGRFNDGRPHRIDVSVVGVPEGQTGWSLPVNVLVWQDARRAHVSGALTRAEAGALANSSTYTPGSENRVDTKGRHRLTVAGYLDTSHGRVLTTVSRTLAHSSAHRWTDGENTDGLEATWTDDEAVTVDGPGPAATTRTRRTYTMDGATTLGADDRLRTVLTLGDRATVAEASEGRRTAWSWLDDTYTGDAAYTVNVPRDQRHAVATTSERYRLYGSADCYDRTLVTVQGVLTKDRADC